MLIRRLTRFFSPLLVLLCFSNVFEEPNASTKSAPHIAVMLGPAADEVERYTVFLIVPLK